MFTIRKKARTIIVLLPYLWEFKTRIVLALSFLILAKLANVSVPLILKEIVDTLNQPQTVLILPVSLLISYGLLRLGSTLFGELRDAVFAKATQRAIRRIANTIFMHLHTLSLRFHLERQTGGVSRDIERGTRGISFLLNFMLFNILPTIFEIGLVMAILINQYDIEFAIIILATLLAYITLTLIVTEWRMIFRRTMNTMDSKANTHAIDSLLNYETVKYFGNETWESQRYDEHLQTWEKAAIRNQTSLAALNSGQSTIIAIGITVLMFLASNHVIDGTMTIGDLVLVNTYLLQLYMPLHFLGFVYREIKHSLTDMERMFSLLDEKVEIQDKSGAGIFSAHNPTIRFNHVNFGYDLDRQILFDVSFDIPAGKTIAVVGQSGSGKSTLARLLFRFYDVQAGSIRINDQDIRNVTQHSLRAAIGIVPQDTVLFNDSIYYNIAYGCPEATADDIFAAAKSAHIHDFIESLPNAYDTIVGERGLKLSGGEKQRIAIARTILKNPAILIFDEATSALDSSSEKQIQAELKRIARNRTTLTIAHRLSTIADADQILVMENGRIIEQGKHAQLLAANRTYARMWTLQQQAHAQNESIQNE